MTKVFLSVTLSLGIISLAHAEKPPAGLSAAQVISPEKSQGSWQQRSKAIANKKFGVGLTGHDEKLLNALDSSSLMDYQETAPQPITKKNLSQPASGKSSKDTTLNNEQGLPKESEFLLIKSFEEALLEDLKN